MKRLHKNSSDIHDSRNHEIHSRYSNQENRIVQCPYPECNSYIRDTSEDINAHNNECHENICVKQRNNLSVDNKHLIDDKTIDVCNLSDDNEYFIDDKTIDIRNLNNLSDEEIIDMFINQFPNERIYDIYYMLQIIIQQQKESIDDQNEHVLKGYFNND